MKTKLIIFFFIPILVSCSQKQGYELADLSNPLLDEWFAGFQSADSSFSIEKFKTLLSDETENRITKLENKWFDYQSDNSVLYVYSSDHHFYIDLDYYTIIEDGVYTGSDIDTKVFLVDVRQGKALEIVNTGSSAWVEDAFWVNDTVFVLLENSEYWDEVKNTWGKGCVPSISIWNTKGEILKVYRYEGNVNYPEISFFEKRLIRHGIKIENDSPLPDNLPDYFQSLIDSHKQIPNYMEDSERVVPVIQSFNLLQEYTEGKLAEYPSIIVKKAIACMLENFAYFDNMEMCDGATCETAETNGYAFFKAYLEQACRLCPDAKLLCNLVSDDGKIGYFDIYSFPITYRPYSGRTVYPHIIYETEQGYFRPKSLDIDESYKKLSAIKHDDTQYYWLSNTESYFGAIFSLLTLKGDSIVECLEPSSMEITRDEFPVSRIFRLKFEDKIYIAIE